MIWGNQKLNRPLILNTTIDIQGEKQKYEVLLKPNTIITVEEFIAKDEQKLMRFSQFLNINMKNVLNNIGFKELDKGKYYQASQLGTDVIKQAQLSVWRGYQINIVSIKSKLYIRADVCSRVLRVESLLETMKNTGRMNDKNFINNMFKGMSIITRYGNHKIHSIDSIDFTLTPKSQLPRYQKQVKPTFI